MAPIHGSVLCIGRDLQSFPTGSFDVVVESASSRQEVLDALAQRARLYTALVVDVSRLDQEDIGRITDAISVLHGRQFRPEVYLYTTQATTKLDACGQQAYCRAASLQEIHDEIPRDKGHEPATPYMLERNPLVEPAWLVDAVAGCFTEPPPGTTFPEDEPGATNEDEAVGAIETAEANEIVEQFEPRGSHSRPHPHPNPHSHSPSLRTVETRAFHSPSLSDDDALRAIMYIFDSLGLLDALEVDRARFRAFLLAVRANYKPNPYHNFQHAVDVLQFAFLLLRSAPEFLEQLQTLEVFALLLAAIGHDVGHTSYNNRFHCASETLLSVLFNDQSVLENYHSLIIFAILRHPRYNFCPSWSAEQWAAFRKLVIGCVLGTDMSAHFAYLKRFSAAQLGSAASLDQESRALLAVLIIKCADISNIIRPFDTARRWGFKLVGEFFCQGDWERVLGQQPSFLTDRFAFDLARGQEHFMLQVAGPLFRYVAETFPGTAFCMQELERNVECWRAWVPEDDELVQASADLRPHMRAPEADAAVRSS